MNRKPWIVGALAIVVVLCASYVAPAANIVRVNPAGEITARSLGRVTMNFQIFQVACRMTLRGRFFESARGDLTGELTRHPQVGQLTAGSVEECTTNSTVRLLFETFFEWLIYAVGIAEARRVGLAVLNVQYLIRVPLLFECLYRVLVMLFYDGDLLEIRSIASLQVTRLAGIMNNCPIPPAWAGRFDLEPDQEFTLESEI